MRKKELKRELKRMKLQVANMQATIEELRVSLILEKRKNLALQDTFHHITSAIGS